MPFHAVVGHRKVDGKECEELSCGHLVDVETKQLHAGKTRRWCDVCSKTHHHTGNGRWKGKRGSFRDAVVKVRAESPAEPTTIGEAFVNGLAKGLTS